MATPMEIDVQEEFKLSSVLQGHTGDIKGVADFGAGVVSVSRDLTARIWAAGPDGEFFTTSVLSGHSRFVLSVVVLPASAQHPNGLILTGSLDTMINVYDPNIDGGPLQQLAGHTKAVCGLTLAPSGLLLSASWDHSAKVWSGDFTCLLTLAGHQASVLAVAAHPTNGSTITASGDKTIKIWSAAGACARTLQGHTDTVRALAILDEVHFASCSNDTTIRVWTFAGDAILAFPAHDNFIYSLCVLPAEAGGDLVSCGEDGTVKVWRNGALVQSIAFPCTSVWTLASRANGDLIVGTDDKIVRIFTRDPSRVAPPAVLNQFHELANATAVARQSAMLGDVDPSTLPSKDRLQKPGSRAGETIMIKEGGTVMAYSWIDGAWVLQGVVTDTKDTDYVTFQVDIDNAKLTLRHKKGENPYLSAQKFLTENEMGQEYLDQVAEFITKNTTTHTLSTGALPVNPDPFTGGGGYVPAPSTATRSTGARYVDPFTGGGAYVTPSAAKSAAAAATVAPTLYFPVASYMTFKAVSGAGMLKKIAEFNQANGNVLLPAELDLLGAFLAHIAAPSTEIDGAAVVAVVQKIAAWPQLQRFPALDLARLLLLSPMTASVALHCPVSLAPSPEAAAHPWQSHVLAAVAGDFATACLQLGGLAGAPAASVAEQGLALKCLANIFATRAGEQIMTVHAAALYAAILATDLATIDIKHLATLAAVVLNLAVQSRASASPPPPQLLNVLTKMLLLFSDETDTVYRLLLALGTVLKGAPAVITAARDAGLVDALTDFYSLQQHEKLKDEIAGSLAEILAMC